MNSAHNQSRNDKRFLGALLCAGIFAAGAGGCAAETDDAGDSTEEEVASESSEAITYIARASVVDPMACAKTAQRENLCPFRSKDEPTRSLHRDLLLQVLNLLLREPFRRPKSARSE